MRIVQLLSHRISQHKPQRIFLKSKGKKLTPEIAKNSILEFQKFFTESHRIREFEKDFKPQRI